LESRAVESDLLDAGSLRTLCDGLADGLRGIDVAGAFEALAHRLLQRRGAGADPSSRQSLLLPLFEGDLLVGVAHALALVGLGRTDVADLRGHLSDLLAVDALDDDLGLARGLDGDSFRDREVHRVGEAEREVEGLALHLRAKADAHELEFLLVALGDTPHHVGEVCARGAGERARLTWIGVCDLEALLRLHHADTAPEGEAQRALRALQRHGAAGDRGGHALRQLDRRFGNSRHGSLRYATMQSTSPPCPMERACLSVMTPFGVETMTVPMPPRTLGSSSLPR